MQVLRQISDYQAWHSQQQGQTIGFVPTMGALHAGHAELLQQAKKNSDLTVLSIFVNPTQFNDKKDFENYPLTIEADLKIAAELKVDAVFLPDYSEIYHDNYNFKISENEFSKQLCGAFRPGHFDGVLTVVMKLFQIVQPHKAFFGEKDFQQMTLIKKMVAAFFLPIKIVAVPTIREESGLAMSSRNTRLSTENRQWAAHIFKTIIKKINRDQCLAELKKLGFEVEYLEEIENRRYVAVRIDGVRLIDNVQI